jgi:hypothetical protein
MQQIEHSSQDAIATALCFMELVSRRLIVAEIHELPGVQIEMIRPVKILAARVEHDELLVFASPGSSEAALVAASWRNLGDGITAGIPSLATFVHGVYNQVCAGDILVRNDANHGRPLATHRRIGK